VRRNGYLGTSNLTLPFAPATSISYKTGIFPLSDDVRGIYLMFFVHKFHLTLWPWPLTFWPWRSTHVPFFIILWLSVPELWVTQSNHITITCNGHCACAVSPDLSPGAKIIRIFKNPEPNLPIQFVAFGALRRRLNM